MERSAGFVIFRNFPKERKYLLLHSFSNRKREKAHWGFSKGHIEKGESSWEAARREAEEETGISDFRIKEGFKEGISYFFKLKGKTVFKRVVFFLAETGKGKARLSKEHSDCLWLGYKEALKRLTFSNSREVLKKANSYLEGMDSFAEKVYKEVREIPRGKVSTYRKIAWLSGRPKAWRAVGNILNKNRDKSVPCHRVIRSDGRIGGYAGGAGKKAALLEKEGLKIHSNGKIASSFPK